MSKTILIMAGGTAGHIFPALAVAHNLRDAGWRVVWLGNPEGMEARLVPQHGFEMVWVKFSALRGKGVLRKLLLPLNLLRGFWQGLKAIRQVKPNVVLGMGGYITFPGGMMAAPTGWRPASQGYSSRAPGWAIRYVRKSPPSPRRPSAWPVATIPCGYWSLAAASALRRSTKSSRRGWP